MGKKMMCTLMQSDLNAQQTQIYKCYIAVSKARDSFISEEQRELRCSKGKNANDTTLEVTTKACTTSRKHLIRSQTWINADAMLLSSLRKCILFLNQGT